MSSTDVDDLLAELDSIAPDLAPEKPKAAPKLGNFSAKSSYSSSSESSSSWTVSYGDTSTKIRCMDCDFHVIKFAGWCVEALASAAKASC